MVKSTKIEIDNMKDKLSYKIFDVININKETYFLDKDCKLLWNYDKEVVGLLKNKNEFILFSEIDDIIDNIKNDAIELESYKINK